MNFEKYAAKFPEYCKGCHYIKNMYSEDFMLCNVGEREKASRIFCRNDECHIISKESPVHPRNTCPCKNCLLKPKCSELCRLAFVERIW